MSQSKLQELKKLEEQEKQLLQRLEALRQDEEVANTQNLIASLREMIESSGLGVDAIVYAVTEVFGDQPTAIAIGKLTGTESKPVGRGKGQRTPREAKTYHNPHEDKTITVKKRTAELQGWYEKYGDEVDTWLVK